MRFGAALIMVSCLWVAACGGSGGGASSAEGVPGGGRTLEQLWQDGGDDVAIVPGTKHYVTGNVRVSFLVVDSQGRPLKLPTARLWVARDLDAKPFLESAAKLERIGIPARRQPTARTSTSPTSAPRSRGSTGCSPSHREAGKQCTRWASW